MLWLFTDPGRGGDAVAAVRRLPAGLCGVVFRHDDASDRAALARAVWAACRARRVPMVVAGAPVGFVGPGRHRRAGRGGRSPGLQTASAHGAADLVRARRAQVGVVFLSPAFPTASHPGARPLGPVRWAGLARAGVYALGGVDGGTARRLPRWVGGAGAIGALA